MTLTLSLSLDLIYERLYQIAISDSFWELLQICFDIDSTSNLALSIQRQWQERDFSQLPSIEVLNGDSMGGAIGAYVSSTNRIYLSDSFLQSASSKSIAYVILEEIGHSLDVALNLVDSEGDEGAIFAELAQGYYLSAYTLAALRRENDQAVIIVNGEVLLAELATYTGTNDNDNIVGTSGNDAISSLRGKDNADGAAGTDLLIIDYSSNVYTGANPASGISTSIGLNSGGSFNGYYYAYYISSDYDQISFSNIELFQITGTNVADTLLTGDGADTINAGGGNDTINPGAGNDVIDAGDGNDIIYTGGGSNSIKGGDGNDSFSGVSDSDTLDGGAGLDWLEDANFTAATSAVTLNELGSSDFLPGTSIRNVERFNSVTLSSGNDTVSFSNRYANTINAGSGNDTINTGLGRDNADGAAGTDLLIVDYSGNAYTGAYPASGISSYIAMNSGGSFNGYYYAYYVSSDYDWINFSNIELFQITGTNVADTLLTGDGADTINAGGGNDTINPGAGNDVIDAGDGNDTIYTGGGSNSIKGGDGNDSFNGVIDRDTLDGGAGLDWIEDANFSAATSAVTLNELGSSDFLPGTSIRNIERFNSVTLTSGNDTVNFNTRYANTINAGSGNDTINTGLGRDNADGAAGTDLLIVDYSGNTYTGANPASGISSYVAMNSGGSFNGYYYTYYVSSAYDWIGFSNIELFQISGTNVADTLLTGDGADTINAGGGNDTINPGAGNDVIDAGDGNDIIYTGGGSNSIKGGDGNDSFNGVIDRDTLDGGAGLDWIEDANFSAATSAVTLNELGSSDFLPGTSIRNIERFNSVTLTSGNDTVSFNTRYANTINAGSGNDTINMGLGRDNADGAAGTDLLIVDYSGNTYTGANPASGISSYVAMNSGGSFNGYYYAYYVSSDYDWIGFSNIELFHITGTNVADTILTGDGADTISAGGGNDTINAGSGNDRIDGVDKLALNPGKGETDILTGGLGNDTFLLGDATRIFYDDGNPASAGANDYATLTDFSPVSDIIQLNGTSSDYLLAVVGSNTNLYINKPGAEPDELVAVINNQTALSLTAGYFFYVTASSLPNISISVAPQSVGEDGTSNLIYTFTRSGSSLAPLSVNFNVGGIATFNHDYLPLGASSFNNTTGTVAFASGSATATLIIDPISDLDIEADESVTLALIPSFSYTIGSSIPVLGMINNDDFPTITLGVSPATVQEDGMSNLIYTFTRTGPTTSSLSVNYTVLGTATLGSDYSGVTGGGSLKTITFAPGASTTSLTVDPIADSISEEDETVVLALAAGTDYVSGTPTSVVGTISDDDLPVITLALSPSVVTEEGTSNLMYTFTRSGPTTSGLTVRYSIAGTASLGVDYAGVAADGTSKTITFAAGSSTATVMVDPLSDSELESNETVSLLVQPGADYIVGTTTPVVGTILNSAPNLIGNGTFETPVFTGAFTFFEGGSTSLPGWSVVGGQIHVNNDGFIGLPAIEGRQYPEITGVVGYNKGLLSDPLLTTPGQLYELSFQLGGFFYGGNFGDPAVDVAFNGAYAGTWINRNTLTALGTDWERISILYQATSPTTRVQLTGSTAGKDLGIGIDDIRLVPFVPAVDDLPIITLSLSPGSVAENATENLVFTFSRTGLTSNPLTVNYSLSGSASLGIDYAGIAQSPTIKSVTFAAGSATAAVTVFPTDDVLLETPETVELTLVKGLDYNIGTPGVVIGTIISDEVPPASVTITAITDNIGLIQGNLLDAAFTDDATPTIIGSLSSALPTGAALQVFNGSRLLGNANVNNATLGWTFTPDALPSTAGAAYAISARVVDAFANLGPISNIRSFTLDTIAPAPPVLALAADLGVRQDDGISNDGLVHVSGLESNGRWYYSTDGGNILVNGSAPSFRLSSGTYITGSILARQLDLAGNISAFGQLPTTVIDTAAPAVAFLNSPAVNGTYGIGMTIPITINFSEDVYVSTTAGYPRLQLETGSIDRYAIYSGGSGSSILSFSYTVQAGDASADLDQRSSSALELNGGTIQDGAGNSALLTLSAPGTTGSLAANKNLQIKGTLPPSLTITANSTSVSEGSSISLALSSDTLASGSTLYWSFSGNGITAADVSPSELSGSLNLGSDRRAAFSRAIALDGVSEGDEQLTISFFNDPGRTLSLGQVQFTLRDLVPTVLSGATDGRDLLIGTSGDDLISGVPIGSLLNGRDSYDTLTGNGGNDVFVLGTSAVVFYNDGNSARTGAADLAVITDFNAGDRIQLKGAAADYRLSSALLSGVRGTLVHWRAAAGAGIADEAIGFVQGLTPPALSLANTSQFLYV